MVLSSKGRLFTALVALTVMFAVNAHADDGSQRRGVTVLHEISAPFDPLQAKMVVSSGEKVIHTGPAAISRTAAQGKVYAVARVVVADTSKSLQFLTVLTDNTGAAFSAVGEIGSLGTDPLHLLDTNGLSERLTDRRTVLESWRVRRAEQDSNIERLQEDADVIANVGRIITVEDELNKINSDIERLSGSLSVAKARLETIKEIPAPRYFARREGELSAELNELSKTLKSTEAEALQRLSAASGGLRDKMALIEATKYQQVEPLNKELAALRRERLELERGLGRTDSRSNE